MTDVGKQPTPQTDPAEPPPGGVDAVEEQRHERAPVVPDVSRLGNATAKDDMPAEVTAPKETDQGASSDGASHPDQEAQA
jgi:hypothetical protein